MKVEPALLHQEHLPPVGQIDQQPFTHTSWGVEEKALASQRCKGRILASRLWLETSQSSSPSGYPRHRETTMQSVWRPSMALQPDTVRTGVIAIVVGSDFSCPILIRSLGTCLGAL